MKLLFARIATLLPLLGACCDGYSMTLSNRGLGQVLEFPYYSVNANQQTLFTLVNSTSNVKALKVRFHEAYDGRTVTSFNVYLSPFDVWTGALYLDGTTTALGTHDTSCTVPKFDAAATTTNIPAIVLSQAAYSGANADGGPTDSSRLREGHVEVFEMGVVANDGNGFAVDATHVNGVPPGCDKLVAAWASGGTWTTAPTTSLTPPTGGLFGSSAVVNVANGTYFAIAPSMVDGFSSTVQHTAPSSAAPDFNTASAASDGSFAATVDIAGELVDMRFTSSVDAVSALFMTSLQINEYVSLPGEQTDWVATFPTKRFYVDPALNASNDPPSPFEFKFGDAHNPVPGSCVFTAQSFFSREERVSISSGCGFSAGCPYDPTAHTLCHETSVVPFSTAGSALHTSLNENVVANNLLGEGYIVFDLAALNLGHSLTAIDGRILEGLPSIGFVAEVFTNQNVTPSVLANYSAAVPHKSSLRCDAPMLSGVCP